MTQYQFEQWRFDSSDGALWRHPGGTRVTLRPQVARFLTELLEHPGRVLSREALCREIWDADRVVDFESGLAAVVKELRRVLAEAGASPELVETVPRRGYRLRVKQVYKPGEGAAGARAGLLAAVAGVVLVVSIWVLWPSVPESEPVPAAPTLAILPFERFGDAGRGPEHVELLLADTLLARLWQLELEDLELVGRASLRPYASRDDASAAVAADLDVSLLMEGSLNAAPDGWQVQVRMLAVPGGRVVWSETVAWPGHAELPVAETIDELLRPLAEQWPEIRAGVGRRPVSE